VIRSSGDLLRVILKKWFNLQVTYYESFLRSDLIFRWITTSRSEEVIQSPGDLLWVILKKWFNLQVTYYESFLKSDSIFRWPTMSHSQEVIQSSGDLLWVILKKWFNFQVTYWLLWVILKKLSDLSPHPKDATADAVCQPAILPSFLSVVTTRKFTLNVQTGISDADIPFTLTHAMQSLLQCQAPVGPWIHQHPGHRACTHACIHMDVSIKTCAIFIYILNVCLPLHWGIQNQTRAQCTYIWH